MQVYNTWAIASCGWSAKLGFSIIILAISGDIKISHLKDTYYERKDYVAFLFMMLKVESMAPKT